MTTSFPKALQDDLVGGLATLGLDARALSRPLLLTCLLDRWNRTYNLTAIRDHARWSPATCSIPGHACLPRKRNLGRPRHRSGPAGHSAGAGPPGPAGHAGGKHGKKARFLREAVRNLGLSNARVAESRAEALQEPAAYDAITARALDSLAGIIKVGGHLLKPGGRLLAMKGVRPDEEIAALPAGWKLEAIHALVVPGLVGERHLVIVVRDH